MTSGLTVTTDYSSRLKVVPLFALLKEADLAYVSSIIKQVKYSAGEVIFREGDESKQFYIIDTGQVAVFRKDSARLEVIVRLLGPGQFFGETGLVRNEPRNATVKATADTTLFAIEKANFETLTRFRDVRKELEAAVQRRGPTLSRFDWQLPDEVAIGVSHRVIVSMIFESAGTLLIWTALAVGLFALSFIHPPRFLPWPPAAPWLLRIGGVATFGLMLVWHVVDWTNDYLVVTNQRVVRVERYGLWREVRNEIPIDAVQNVVLSRKGVLAALLKLSDIIVETIGGRLTFTHIPNGQFMQERILDQRTLAQQEAKREEVETIRRELLRVLSPASLAQSPEPQPTPASAQPAAPAQSQEAAPEPAWLDWLRGLRPQLRVEKSGQIIWHKHWLLLLWRLVIPVLIFMAGIGVSYILWRLPHWITRFSPLPTWAILTPGGLIVLASFLMGWWEYMVWDQDLYILTSNRIVDIERRPFGLKETRRESNLDRIQDIDVDLPNIWSRMFDMGNVHIKTGAAGSDLTFRSVAHPHSIQRDIFHQLAELRRKEQEQERRQRGEEMSKWLAVYSQLTTQAKVEE
jgi:hypothetical protein